MSVSAEVTILVNVTDNKARYKCEASNSATEIPLSETVTLNVLCKYSGSALFYPLKRKKVLVVLVLENGIA
jgi:hypothetical protein